MSAIASINVHTNLFLILQRGRIRYVTRKSHLILVVDKNLSPLAIPDESQIMINWQLPRQYNKETYYSIAQKPNNHHVGHLLYFPFLAYCFAKCHFVIKVMHSLFFFLSVIDYSLLFSSLSLFI